jgi:hypothetical protein
MKEHLASAARRGAASDARPPPRAATTGSDPLHVGSEAAPDVGPTLAPPDRVPVRVPGRRSPPHGFRGRRRSGESPGRAGRRVVPAGTRWISSSDKFFLPVRVLTRVFRGKFLDGLRSAFARGRLSFPGALTAPAVRDEFERLLASSTKTDWVVHAKPPFGGLS